MKPTQIKTVALGSAVALTVLFQNCSSNFSTLESIGDSSRLVIDTSKFSVDKKDNHIAQYTQQCPDAAYAGFNCLDKVFTTAEGKSYNVTFRWNRTDQQSRGTVIWVLGGDGKGKWHESPEAIAIQEDLSQNHQLRSVEIEFTDGRRNTTNAGGYWVHAGGYYSAALAYMEAVGYVTANLKVGQFMNHVGGSNGSAVPAYALSHFDAGNYVDRFIFHAGPFLPSLTDACDDNHFASFSKSPVQLGTIYSFLAQWGLDNPNQNICTSGDKYRMSLLDGAKKVYPRNGIHVVMGDKERTEGFGPWIIESNFQWYSQIEAADKTRTVSMVLGHEMDWATAKMYAAMSPPQAMGAAPTLTFSLSQGGPAALRVPLDSQLHGVIQNIPSGAAMGCMAESTQLARCENPHNWITLPNGEWSFSRGLWRSTFTPVQLNLQVGKTYQGFNINMQTGQRTPIATFTVVEAATATTNLGTTPNTAQPFTVFSNTEGGGAATIFDLDQVVYGATSNLPQVGTKACMQEQSQFYLCDNESNWVSLPNNEWSYVNGQWKARFIPQAIGAQAGKTYYAIHINTQTRQITPRVALTISPKPVATPKPGQNTPAAMSFSATDGGAVGTRFYLDQVVYGTSTGFPEFGTKACMQEASNFHLCSNPSNWVSLPNSQWRYVGDNKWKSSFKPGSIGAQSGKTYYGIQINTATGEQSSPAMLTID